MRPRRLTCTLALALLTLLAGCGNGDKPQLTVSAASSLTDAFQSYGKSFQPANARFSFAGSDDLAAQIRQGAHPDVYAAAETQLPQQLFKEGLVERPVDFATNTLVVAVPADSKIHSLGGLAKSGTAVVIGSQSVPAGSYAREVLGRLGSQGRSILANVRSEESDVKGVIGKLTEGGADAGFVYVTDVKAAGGSLRAVQIPPRLQPDVTYAVAVLKDAPQPDQAVQFVRGLLHGDGAADLRRADFGAAPGP